MVRSLNGRLTLIAFTALLSALAAGSLSPLEAANITLSWVDNSNNENGFEIQRKIGTSGTFMQQAIVGVGITSYVDTGLAAATTFCYQVRAFNSAGNSAFTPQACKTTPSGATTFDFSLAHGGNKSVIRGKSVSNVITATLTSGSSQSVSFVTSGLPNDATASYTTSTSCNPTCSRTLNIATSSSTPTGTFTVTVTGSGGGVAKIATFNLAVTSSDSSPTEPENGNLTAPMVSRSDSTASALFDTAESITTKIGVYRPSTGDFFLDRNGNGLWDGCTVDVCLKWLAQKSGVPVAGNWDGGDTTRIGTFDVATGTWYLDRNGNNQWDGCEVDTCITSFGAPGDVSVVRSATGSDRPSIGVFPSAVTNTVPRKDIITNWGLWKFDASENSISDGCQLDSCFWKYANPGDFAVVGDWDGDGIGNISVFDASRGSWLLDNNGNGLWDGCAVDKCLSNFGQMHDLPVAGDWDGTGKAMIGVFRPSTGEWFLDKNGNGQLDGCGVDTCVRSFGNPGDLPVVGKW